jgi:hypothetical protein
MRNMIKKRALMIPGGGIRRDKNGKWRTNRFSDKGDNFGISGGRLRVVAGSLLYKNDNNLFIIASGGKGQLKNIPGVPCISSVVKGELVGLKVLLNKIIEDNKSNNTYQQLMELKKIILKHKLNEVIIISNKFHLPRIRALIGINKELKKKLDINFIKLKSAEEILIKYNAKRWKKLISNIYKGAVMKKRIALEKRGVKDIKEGKYKFNK